MKTLMAVIWRAAGWRGQCGPQDETDQQMADQRIVLKIDQPMQLRKPTQDKGALTGTMPMVAEETAHWPTRVAGQCRWYAAASPCSRRCHSTRRNQLKWARRLPNLLILNQLYGKNHFPPAGGKWKFPCSCLFTWRNIGVWIYQLFLCSGVAAFGTGILIFLHTNVYRCILVFYFAC